MFKGLGDLGDKSKERHRGHPSPHPEKVSMWWNGIIV